MNTKLLIARQSLGTRTARPPQDWHIRSSLGFDILHPTTNHAPCHLTWPFTFLPPLPCTTTKREIWTGNNRNLHTAPPPLWWKPVTIKTSPPPLPPYAPATLYSNGQKRNQQPTGGQHQTSPNSSFTTSNGCRMTSETRCWILNKQVIGASTYLHQKIPPRHTCQHLSKFPPSPPHLLNNRNSRRMVSITTNTDTITAPDGQSSTSGTTPKQGHSIIGGNPHGQAPF